MGTMEEKIYERQVTKLAISKRVIDEHQIDRHYKENDLMELYNIDGIEMTDEDRPQPKLPKDRLFAEQLQKYPNLIFKYHEHDSLLENKSDETLSEEEIKAAWKEFEEEKNRPTIAVVQPSLGYPTYQRGEIVEWGFLIQNFAKFMNFSVCVFFFKNFQHPAPDPLHQIIYSVFEPIFYYNCSI